jgi:hypothetical protein
MTDSLLKGAANKARGRCSVWPYRSIVPASKMTHYIGSLKMVIATARVASVILTVEGYACAPQQQQALGAFSAAHVPKTAQYAG